ncbi:hypothetical protein RchiOBHm_Chr2g0163351 [Rosa chinensis]|uniref:Uncharacterized protein n=1 Tax=Rosa chinensis TaxID=74649 RepID=A0A2P6S394_ROSCH|nr:hypothetical protein RchiOBHm_Chr2g0163351 [Rosa chinensis]
MPTPNLLFVSSSGSLSLSLSLSLSILCRKLILFSILSILQQEFPPFPPDPVMIRSFVKIEDWGAPSL